MTHQFWVICSLIDEITFRMDFIYWHGLCYDPVASALVELDEPAQDPNPLNGDGKMAPMEEHRWDTKALEEHHSIQPNQIRPHDDAIETKPAPASTSHHGHGFDPRPRMATNTVLTSGATGPSSMLHNAQDGPAVPAPDAGCQNTLQTDTFMGPIPVMTLEKPLH